MSTKRPLVVVLASQSVSPFEIAAAFELFGVDRRVLAPRWYRFALAGTKPLRWAGSVRLTGFQSPSIAQRADMLVVPAHSGLEQPPEPWVVEALQRAHRRGARVVSFCTGAFALGHAGLLRRATTHWMHAEAFRRAFPQVAFDAAPLWVRDRNVWTAAGTASCIDLGLAIIAEDFGQQVANQVARRIVAAPTRSGEQAQFIDRPVPVVEDALEPARQYALEHLADDHSVPSLAKRVAMSPRSFARHFVATMGTTPHAWLLEQRVTRAKVLLENPRLSVDEVARLVGLATPTLRSRFRALVGMSPTTYRRAFSPRQLVAA